MPHSRHDISARACVHAFVKSSTEQLDLLQLYWWDYEKANYLEMAQNAQQLVSQPSRDAGALSRQKPGTVRGLGVTGFDAKHLRELVEGGVDVVTAQMSFSVGCIKPSPQLWPPTPYTLHLTPYTLHPAPYTLHLTPYTLHPTP